MLTSPPPLPPRSRRRHHAVANALPRRCHRCQRAADATVALPAATALLPGDGDGYKRYGDKGAAIRATTAAAAAVAIGVAITATAADGVAIVVTAAAVITAAMVAIVAAVAAATL